RIGAQHPHVFDLLRLAPNSLYALGQPLDAEKISLWELLRYFAQKRSITAPKIDMQRRGASKKLHEIQTLDLHFYHRGKCRHLTDAQPPNVRASAQLF